MKDSQEIRTTRRAVIMGLLLAASGAAFADTKFYDRYGSYTGKRTDDGKLKKYCAKR